MIERDVLSKFYKQVSPYPGLINTVGLLYSARIVDTPFALSQVTLAFKQKTPSYCIIIMHETTDKGRPVTAFKVYKKGKHNLANHASRIIPWFTMEYDSDRFLTHGVVKSSAKKKLSQISSKVQAGLLRSASFAGYKYILFYDTSKNVYSLWSRLSNRTNDKRTSQS